MHSRRRSFALSLLVVMTWASSATSCRDKVSDALDGASDAAASDGALIDDAAIADASSAFADGATIGINVAVAASAAAPVLPRPTPFTGKYLCFKGGMELDQQGSIVISTMHKDATVDTIIACTAIGDTCRGTMRDIHLVKTKAKKVGNIRPVTLLRTAAGDVIVKLAPEQSASSTKSTSSRAAAGDQTFCRRR